MREAADADVPWQEGMRMSGRSSLVARLFWTTIVGGGFAFWFGRPALAATGLCLGLILLHRLDRPRRFRRTVRRLARAHAETLALRRRQECFEDAYGNRIDDGWLRERGDWVPLGAADEKKEAAAGTVEAWARDEKNPVGGWYGLRKGYRGRFGMYLPPLLEALGLAELTHDARNNSIRAL